MYPKLLHGTQTNEPAITSLMNGWATRWKNAGVSVVGWGWLEGDPRAEAEQAVYLCGKYGLDGWIANAETSYEGPANYWKTDAYLAQFRRFAPHAPLALSYIGQGGPHRDMPLWEWEDYGAAMMPQCYWADSSTSIYPSWTSAMAANLSASRIVPTLGTSGFGDNTYPAEAYAYELDVLPRAGGEGFNVWLLDSTPDEVLRTLSTVI